MALSLCPCRQAVSLSSYLRPRPKRGRAEKEPVVGCIGLCAVGHGGRARTAGVPRRSRLRKSRAEPPCCQQVRHTDISTACARAPAQVRLPPQTFRRMTPKRIANSARQLVASRPGWTARHLAGLPGPDEDARGLAAGGGGGGNCGLFGSGAGAPEPPGHGIGQARSVKRCGANGGQAA